MDYSEYLLTDHWKQTRINIRRRSGGWCERCKINQSVDVHHLSYERLGHELDTDLMALCRYCHSFLHGKANYDAANIPLNPQQVEYLRALVISGNTPTEYWKELIVNEPRIMTLHLKALHRFDCCLQNRPQDCPNKEYGVDEYYCSEYSWMEEFKPILINIVGDYSNSPYRGAWTNRAYDTVYQTIYHAIRTCPRMMEP